MNIKSFDKFNEEFVEKPGVSGATGKKVDSWVNIKIDNDLPLRISRYAKSLDEYVEATDLRAKLEILSNPKSKNIDYGAQCQLSIMILLQYLKEIKSNFEPSSAGFLFEDFIAGLLHSKRHGGYVNADFITHDNKKCQIKFYTAQKGQIKVRAELCDKYIIGLKGKDEAKIWILETKKDINKYVIPYVNVEDENEILHHQIDVTSLKNPTCDIKPYILKFDNIDRIIRDMGDGLKKFITDLYNSISDLNYNIETIITGIDKEKRIVDIKDVDKYYKMAEDNMKNIKIDLEGAKKNILSRVKRKYGDI